jgi:hypothetical protein
VALNTPEASPLVGFVLIFSDWGLVMRGQLLLFFILVGIFVIPSFISCQSAQPAMAAPTTIDWAQGAIQDTPVSCGAMVFKNLDDKHSYSLLVRGTVSSTCSFEAQGLHFHLPFNHGATTDGSPTLYNFIRFGSDVYVTYMPGY